jgi:hypothetical protein
MALARTLLEALIQKLHCCNVDSDAEEVSRSHLLHLRCYTH